MHVIRIEMKREGGPFRVAGLTEQELFAHKVTGCFIGALICGALWWIT